MGSVATAVARAAACPPAYALPDPKRPRLSAIVSFSGATVTGSEHLVFTPDLPVSEVVLRLWAAAPRSARAGGGIDIATTKVDGRAVPSRRSSATVLRIPARVAAGRSVTVDVAFTLRLPTGINDRFGHRGTTAWFGSGLPLLAWERGRGWALEPATSAFAEASTSEAMELTSLTVRRARGLSIIATGVQVADDGTTARFRARSVRDVAVAVGRLRVAHAAAGDVPIVVGVAPGLADDPTATANALARAMRVHAARFGQFPFERLAVAVLPDIGGGIEYPAAILLGKGQTRDATASHEVAHEWWYGLIGDDQARDPWLDESFATYAEALDRGTGAAYERMVIPAGGRGRTGAPMTFWESRQSIYFRSVYIQGAVALLRARRAAGAAAFDDALRCHVRRNAHRITTPADLRLSLQALPAAIRVLTAAGALR
ncbi:MAG: uncharacterized protein JWP11_1255 [Frankiales bacterium]|nr:uncharacterized protein [Frankiales bacterium]